jgi:hypothetical protein
MIFAQKVIKCEQMFSILPFTFFLLQAYVNDLSSLITQIQLRWNLIMTIIYFLLDFFKCFSIVRYISSEQLVKHHSKWPDIAFLCVFLFEHYLWRHVNWSTTKLFSFPWLLWRKDFWKPEVWNLNLKSLLGKIQFFKKDYFLLVCHVIYVNIREIK